MFDLSPIKIMVIVAVVMVLLGPDKLPEVARKLGASWRALKNLQERVESEVRSAIPDLPSTGDIARIARSPVNLLNQLADRVDLKESLEEKDGTRDEQILDSEAFAQPLMSPPQRRTTTLDSLDGSALPPDPSLN
ncbi:MAG: Sec-independent protein translocase subunit TatA/TatB [Acidimicrobiales bacterium]